MTARATGATNLSRNGLARPERLLHRSLRGLCSSFLSSDFGVEGFHNLQNHVNDGLVANRCVDHRVVNGAVRPLDTEILLDKIGALSVNCIHKLFGFLLTL